MARYAFYAIRLVVAICSVEMALVCVAQQVPDGTFKASVEHPANVDRHPRVLFDEAHFNVHSIQGSYRAFAELLRSDGYEIKTNAKPFTTESLTGYDVLITANPRGAAQRSEKPAFTEQECDAVCDWVRGGGTLLLVVDHYPTGHAAEILARRFDVDWAREQRSIAQMPPPAAQAARSSSPETTSCSRTIPSRADETTRNA